ncbi:hypothetical protein C1645_830309 [Glomus cerebriforme]|uniref:Uncharacterized protein n=1 Tax=Glomus cerebriforme TaxID=658196 RepID=A0A397SLJ4_9GLOM|nr:hypothetical protein C1645_830309 [Glomus cerebriforme]
MGGGSSNGSSPVEIEKRSLSFWSDTEKWEMVLRALRSGMGRETVLYTFSSILESETVLCAFGSILESKMFSELFSPDWEGKTLLCAFSSILESETVFRALQSRLGGENASLCFRFDTGIRNGSLSFQINFSLVQTLGIRKWFLDFISGIEISSQNSHLMHLLKESLLENLVSFEVKTLKLSFQNFAPELGKPKCSGFGY